MGHLGDGTESTGLGVDFPTPAGMDDPETADLTANRRTEEGGHPFQANPASAPPALANSPSLAELWGEAPVSPHLLWLYLRVQKHQRRHE